jgi:Spy/CpxP family protein refolding chaperone
MPFDRTNRKAIALLVVIFCLGIALGAVGHVLVDRNVFAARQRLSGQGTGQRSLNRLTEDLSLTAEQQERLSGILAETKARYDAIRESVNPQYQQVREESNERIRQILTPEQRPKFEDYLARRRKENRAK